MLADSFVLADSFAPAGSALRLPLLRFRASAFGRALLRRRFHAGAFSVADAFSVVFPRWRCRADTFAPAVSALRLTLLHLHFRASAFGRALSRLSLIHI